MKKDKKTKLITLLEPKAQEHGFELVDVELVGIGQNQSVRVYLDGPSPLGIDDIVKANKWVDAVIEANEPFMGKYMLEVSSPGIDRPLRTLEHFARFVGEDVKIVSEKIDGRANWSGKIAGVDGSNVVLELDQAKIMLPIDQIKKAHLKGRVKFL